MTMVMMMMREEEDDDDDDDDDDEDHEDHDHDHDHDDYKCGATSGLGRTVLKQNNMVLKWQNGLTLCFTENVRSKLHWSLCFHHRKIVKKSKNGKNNVLRVFWVGSF